MFFFAFFNNNIIKNNIKIFCSSLLKRPVRNQILGLYLSQSLDGVISQKHVTAM